MHRIPSCFRCSQFLTVASNSDRSDATSAFFEASTRQRASTLGPSTKGVWLGSLSLEPVEASRVPTPAPTMLAPSSLALPTLSGVAAPLLCRLGEGGGVV
eukprot:CAMPEP_0173322752 /NCGR_PEP_ID=MMETSP1143-20121109/30145_1 /TAXON_ID=483371 /ORGANISM="non described non described, Strain CCMP2298" /LENGTH=99 /DNA_ID=CAMNT_0014266659 /DNA_START=233 /DNA_END=530 /DNA_ORIENTATION=-